MLSDVINASKNVVIAAWRTGVRDQGWPRFQEHLWQRAFHENIIGDERDLETVLEYILGNPIRRDQKRRGYL